MDFLYLLKFDTLNFNIIKLWKLFVSKYICAIKCETTRWEQSLYSKVSHAWNIKMIKISNSLLIMSASKTY